MKRLIISLILVALICSVGFAKEAGATSGAVSANFNYRIVSGGFWACGQDFSGGFGEFGVNLLPREKSFVLRDCIYVQGEGGYLDSQKQFSFGGFEFQFAKRSAFALEFGGVKRFFAGGEEKVFEDFSKFTPLLTMGYRTFR